VSSYYHTSGLEALICRRSNYGPHQYLDKLIPLMILNALARDRLPVHGDGCNVRNSPSWRTRGIGHALVHGAPGEVYNCGGPDECEARTVRWDREDEWWWEPIRSGAYREYYERHYRRALKSEIWCGGVR
jgi:dTDP-glucose 4,6-dehydratase